MTVFVAGADRDTVHQLAGAVTTASDRVAIVVPADLEVDVTGPAVAALLSPGDVLVVGADQRSRDLAGWVSATLDLPTLWAAERVDVTAEGVTVDRPVLGGTHRLGQHAAAGGAVVSVKVAGGDPSAALAELPVDLTATSSVQVTDGGCTDGQGPSLASAKVIVSVGRGIGGPDHVSRYRELAELSGAALGASRVAVDSGWIPFAHQVGQTGAAVAPDVYVAFGISGAVQHLAGMRASKRIIAVNTDPDAPICRLADLVVRADANDVADALVKKFADAGRTA